MVKVVYLYEITPADEHLIIVCIGYINKLKHPNKDAMLRKHLTKNKIKKYENQNVQPPNPTVIIMKIK